MILFHDGSLPDHVLYVLRGGQSALSGHDLRRHWPDWPHFSDSLLNDLICVGVVIFIYADLKPWPIPANIWVLKAVLLLTKHRGLPSLHVLNTYLIALQDRWELGFVEHWIFRNDRRIQRRVCLR